MNDSELVSAIRSGGAVTQDLVDEYYRRCIPYYLDILGIHWHTGFYLDDGEDVCSRDQDRMVRFVADSIGICATDRVLDVGCGVGGAAFLLGKEYGCAVCGLTPLDAQRRIALALLQRFDVGARVRIDLGHASSLPYPDNSFDVVTFFESPCHFPDRALFFREALRVLKPGGRLAGEDWLATESAGRPGASPGLDTLCRSWFIPMLGTGPDYLRQMQDAGFHDRLYVDTQSEMLLRKGFAVTNEQRRILQDEIRSCSNPLVGLILNGLLRLGEALDLGVFTVGRFLAHRPRLAQPYVD